MQKYLPAFEKLLFILTLLLLVAIPLYPKFPFLNVSGTFVAIRLEDFLIGLTLLTWGIYIILSKQVISWLRDNLNQAVLLFFFVGLVSVFSAIFLTHTVQPHLAILHYLRRIELIMLLPLMLTVVKTKKQVVSLLIVMGLVLVTVNIYALGQLYLGWPVITTTNSELSKGEVSELAPGGRINSTFAGHYDLAVYLMMALSFMAAFLFSNFQNSQKSFSSFTFRNLWLQMVLLMLSGLSFVVLMINAARFSFVAALAGVAAAFLLSGKKILIFIIVLAAIGIMIYPSQLRDRLISTITININQGGERYVETDQLKRNQARLNIPTLSTPPVATPSATPDTQVEDIKKPSDIVEGEPLDATQLGVYRSFRIRLDVEWPRAIRAFMKNHLLGTGYSSLDLATDNDYLRILGEIGLLGTLAFALVLIEIGKRVWRGIRNTDKLIRYLSIGTFAMGFGFLANAVFIDVFEASKVATLFWMVSGLTLASLKLK